jgi:hypothetical protein
MPDDPITLPSTTDSVGTVSMTSVFEGLRRRKWWHVFAVTADYAVDADSEFLSVDATQTGGVEITLEAATDVDGKAIIVYSEILNTGDTLTITPATGDTIDGSASLTITVQGKFVHLISDAATNWILYIDGR